MNKKSYKAFSLVELLIATALSMLLVLGLISLLTSVVKSYHIQHDSQTIYAEATTLSSLWQTAFVSVGDFGDPILQARGVIHNCLPHPLLTPNGISVYSANSAELSKFLPVSVIKKLLPRSEVIVTEQVTWPFEHLQYDAALKKFYLNTSSEFQAGDEVLIAGYQAINLLKIIGARRQKNRLYLDLPLPENNEWRIAHWQTSIWFAMQNETGNYGVYRMIIPNEKTPVEFVRNVIGLTANVSDKFLTAKVSFQKNQQSLVWSMTLPFMQPALGWRTW